MVQRQAISPFVGDAVSAAWWYALVGACVACYTLGALHALTKVPRKWRCLWIALAAGAVWPLALLLGAVTDWAERARTDGDGA